MENILIDGKNIGRIYDIAIDGIKYELKNWSQFFPSTIKTQFIRDLSNIDHLTQLKWVFNKTGGMPDIGTLKTKVLKALKKADGSPVDELVSLFKNDPNKVFSKRMSDLFKTDINNAKDLLEEIGSSNNFNKIFEVVK